MKAIRLEPEKLTDCVTTWIGFHFLPFGYGTFKMTTDKVWRQQLWRIPKI